MKTVAAYLATTLLLSGCLLNPVKVQDAEPISPASDYTGRPGDGKAVGTIIIVRDSGFYGTLADVIVFVDGKRVGILRPGQKFTLPLSEGSHVVGINCGSCDESARKEVQHVVTRGRTDAFRVNFAAGLNIQPSTQLD